MRWLNACRRELGRRVHKRGFRDSQQRLGNLSHRDQSLDRISGEHPAEEGIKRLGCLCGHHGGINRADLFEYLERVFGRKGRLAGAELVEEYSQRKDIAGQGRWFATDLLG